MMTFRSWLRGLMHRPGLSHRPPTCRPRLEALEDRAVPAGQLDPTFGDGGKVTTDVGVARGLAAYQDDGKMVLVGSSGLNAVVTRYNPDGSLDGSFGDGGIVRFNFGGTYNSATGVTVDDEGRVLVAGYVSVGDAGYDFAVARLTADGELDSSFGDGGVQTIDFGRFDTPYGVALDGNGQVIIVGTTVQAGGSPVETAVARLTADGELDASFGDGGKQVISLDAVSGVTVDGQNRVVLVGTNLGAPPLTSPSPG